VSVSRRITLLAAGVVTLLVGGAACRTPAPPPARRALRLTTGTPGASFHPLSQALASVWAEGLPDLAIASRDSPGSIANLEAMLRGEADIGLAYADVAYAAYAGQLGSTRQKAGHVRGVAVLELSPVHLVIRRGAGIRRIEDLRGRRVAIGLPGSGSAVTAEMVLKAHDLDIEAVRVEALRYNEAASRLGAGGVDALFVTGREPIDAVRAAVNAGARIVAIQGPAIERLRHDYPFFRRTVVPGGTYPGHPDTIETIGLDNILVCRTGLDEGLVHDLTQVFFAGLPALRMVSEIDLDQAPATPIPLHDGAARYYRERELSR
jgi:hypothetical protein